MHSHAVRRASPAIFALYGPKPPLGSFTKEYSENQKPSEERVVLRGRCRFFGANSVASALGASPGATPARLCEHTMRVGELTSKPELSTWLRTGSFYFAPTGVAHQARNSPYRPLILIGGF